MILKTWIAVCDECYMEGEVITAFSPSHIRYIEMVREQGWIVTRKYVLCPDCVANGADLRLSR